MPLHGLTLEAVPAMLAPAAPQYCQVIGELPQSLPRNPLCDAAWVQAEMDSMYFTRPHPIIGVLEKDPSRRSVDFTKSVSFNEALKRSHSQQNLTAARKSNSAIKSVPPICPKAHRSITTSRSSPSPGGHELAQLHAAAHSFLSPFNSPPKGAAFASPRRVSPVCCPSQLGQIEARVPEWCSLRCITDEWLGKLDAARPAWSPPQLGLVDARGPAACFSPGPSAGLIASSSSKRSQQSSFVNATTDWSLPGPCRDRLSGLDATTPRTGPPAHSSLQLRLRNAVTPERFSAGCRAAQRGVLDVTPLKGVTPVRSWLQLKHGDAATPKSGSPSHNLHGLSPIKPDLPTPRRASQDRHVAQFSPTTATPPRRAVLKVRHASPSLHSPQATVDPNASPGRSKLNEHFHWYHGHSPFRRPPDAQSPGPRSHRSSIF